jgi:hypothetical protein
LPRSDIAFFTARWNAFFEKPLFSSGLRKPAKTGDSRQAEKAGGERGKTVTGHGRGKGGKVDENRRDDRRGVEFFVLPV